MALAQQADASHSIHGKAFDAGPRQRAHPLTGIGTLHWPVTTKSEEAQRFVDQGLNCYWSFWYYESERAFRQAIALDPECAMAYLGVALNAGGERGRVAMELARKYRDKVTDREKAYIDAFDIVFGKAAGGSEERKKSDAKADEKAQEERDRAFVRALDDMILAYPDDTEPKMMLVDFLQQQTYGYEKRLGSRAVVEGLIKEVLAQNPNHPGAHHFRIHLFDNNHDELSLASCAAYPKLAPNIGHAQHMPGHIYSSLGRWQEAADAMDAGARMERAYFASAGRMPFQSWNYAHNQDFQISNLGYLGRIKDGLALAQELADVPCDPTENPADGYGTQMAGRESRLRMQIRGERWDEIATEQGGTWPESDEGHGWKAFALAMSALGRRDVSGATSALKTLEDLGKKIDGPALNCARQDIRGRLWVLQGQTDKGIAELQEAVKTYKEQIRYNDPNPYPYPVVEALAWAYQEAKRPAEAQKTLEESLKTVPNNGYALARLVEVQVAQGKQAEAQETLSKLRAVWAHADADLPALKRVQALNLPGEPFPTPAITRPEIAALGPAFWKPFPLPNVTLTDDEGKAVPLSDYKGRNVLLVFTLGGACPHCQIQLLALSKERWEFRKRNTWLITASTDAPEKIHAFVKDNPDYPIRVLSDPKSEVERALGVYDEFENKELHAVLLIDAKGRVWWFRSGSEPFADVNFLKSEIDRMNHYLSRQEPAIP